jgi:nesprin-1
MQSIRQNEGDMDKLSDDGSDLVQITGESRLSNTVQQVTSRFQGLQTTAKVCPKLEDSKLAHDVVNGV